MTLHYDNEAMCMMKGLEKWDLTLTLEMLLECKHRGVSTPG